MAEPQPVPLLPAACSSLPHCCQEPLFLLWAPMSWLGSVTDIQASDWEEAVPAGAKAKPKAVCSQGTHSIASSAASWQGDMDLQGADSSVAESPPGPLALELMPAGEVSLGTGIPGGRCEVQPGSCQYFLRED